MIGPKTVPWGTLDLTLLWVDVITTCCVLLVSHVVTLLAINTIVF